jgi:hypothetical protein
MPNHLQGMPRGLRLLQWRDSYRFMTCEICKKDEAKVHLTLLENEHMRKVDLCESCAKTYGVNDPLGFSLAGLLQQLGKRDNPNVE